MVERFEVHPRMTWPELCPKCRFTGRVRCLSCLCQECNGKGGHSKLCQECNYGRIVCPECHGKGKVRRFWLVYQICKRCSGRCLFPCSNGECRGGWIHSNCSSCNGVGVYQDCPECRGERTIECRSCEPNQRFPALLTSLPIVENYHAVQSDGVYYESRPFKVRSEQELIEKIRELNARRNERPSQYHTGPLYPLVFYKRVNDSLQLKDAQMEGEIFSIERVSESGYTLAGIDGDIYEFW